VPPVKHPTSVRLETFVEGSWKLETEFILLLHPERYAARLAAKGKVGRAIELDERFRPTGKVWEGSTSTVCSYCEETHTGPHDGRCLL